MSFHEKSQWAYAFAAFVTAAVYFAWLGTQLGDTPAADIDYRGALLWTIGISMVIHALGTGFVRGATPKGEDKPDLRDRDVNRRGDALSFYVFSALAAGPLVLALVDAPMFWVANVLFAAFAFTAVFGVVAKSVLYRKGF
ncbi:MAG: hypothetical protein CVT64_08950 [Actinobacteria bacterium HGW-Actinobacteria-4]|nr:MAG: hypothetical protein CVT64_08950 [Actinobacteria bacterium HGW-Actinobacteria-4]